MTEKKDRCDELRVLMDDAFRRALDLLGESGGKFAPFLILEDACGTSIIESNAGPSTRQEAVLKKHARGLTASVKRCALVRDGTVTVNREKVDAVLVEGSQRGNRRSVVLARPFRRPGADQIAQFSAEPLSLASRKSLFAARRWRRWLVVGLLLVVGTAALTVLNNNVSLSSTSPAEFEKQLDLALEDGTKWIGTRTGSLAGVDSNPALLYMIRDMAELSGEPRLEAVVTLFMETWSDTPWRRLVDRDAVCRAPLSEKIGNWKDYQRWMFHASSPDLLQLTEEDRMDMLSPSKHRRGSLTHQLFALHVMRQRGRSDEEIDRLIDTLCERIASEAALDFRVCDIYIQRVAFVLAAGHPELIKRRWIERILDHQHENGGFRRDWHGWGPGVLEFDFQSREPNAHTTVQGVWILYMLKHRYPKWIEQRFD